MKLLPLLFLTLFTFFNHLNAIPVKGTVSMDDGWKFALGHAYDPAKDFETGTSYFSYYTKAGYGDGASALDFDDRAWRKLDLPHDWVVEQGFASDGSHSHGYKAVGRNYPETSVGWYRKHFFVEEADLGKRFKIYFEGVHRDSQVWINGHLIGEHYSGNTGFTYDLTDMLNYGGDNVIAVRCDITMEEGWYYEGGGIYRHVWLFKQDPLHIKQFGVTIRTDSENKGKVSVETEIANEGKEAQRFTVEQKVLSPEGEIVAKAKREGVSIDSLESGVVDMTFKVTNPQLWDLKTPYLYSLETILKQGDKVLDVNRESFGIRTIHFDPNKGFFLNGKHVKLKGTNNHHEHAGVGIAIPDALEDWRVKRLKTFSNAYRCSHDPASPAFLDSCDRLGMLVIDENRLMGTNDFQLDELKYMVDRDKNHPSVIVWSIGNEEWAIEGNDVGTRIAGIMQDYVHKWDPTRQVTAAISGGWGQGISKVVDVMGYNYINHGSTDQQHKDFPWQAGVGTEESSNSATRGCYKTDKDKHSLAAYDHPADFIYNIEKGWKHYDERDYLAGLFYWTGFDYRGEPTPYAWPSVLSYFGLMDNCGFYKDDVYYLKSWWTGKPTLHLLPHWNWKGKEGQKIKVVAMSNCDEVELFLNGKSFGSKIMPKNGHLEWMVPYEAGKLIAKGYKNGKQTLTETVETTGDATSVVLKADKTHLKADNSDLAVVSVSFYDSEGRHVPTANEGVTFSVSGPAKIIGVGNGDQTSLEKDRYIDSYQQIAIKNLRTRWVDRIVKTDIIPSNPNRNWSEFTEHSSLKPKGKYIAISGIFDLPEMREYATVTVYGVGICNPRELYINGNLVSANFENESNLYEFTLKKEWIHEGTNVITQFGTPYILSNPWDHLNVYPGIVQVFTPANQYKRKTFNGYAQLLLQSTYGEGEIVLKAESNHKKAAELKFHSSK